MLIALLLACTSGMDASATTSLPPPAAVQARLLPRSSAPVVPSRPLSATPEAALPEGIVDRPLRLEGQSPNLIALQTGVRLTNLRLTPPAAPAAVRAARVRALQQGLLAVGLRAAERAPNATGKAEKLPSTEDMVATEISTPPEGLAPEGALVALEAGAISTPESLSAALVALEAGAAVPALDPTGVLPSLAPQARALVEAGAWVQQVSLSSRAILAADPAARGAALAALQAERDTPARLLAALSAPEAALSGPLAAQVTSAVADVGALLAQPTLTTETLQRIQARTDALLASL